MIRRNEIQEIIEKVGYVEMGKYGIEENGDIITVTQYDAFCLLTTTFSKSKLLDMFYNGENERGLLERYEFLKYIEKNEKAKPCALENVVSSNHNKFAMIFTITDDDKKFKNQLDKFEM